MSPDWESKRILITVKTYPNPSWSFKETVCIAGITDEGNWIRVYPIKYRQLPIRSQFKKYDIVHMQVYKDRHDIRPESYRPNPESIRIIDHLPSSDNWAARKAWVLPSLSGSMCYIQEMQKSNKITLGVFKPANVRDFIIEDDDSRWPERKLQVLNQLELFERPLPILEKIPHTFKYLYTCNDSNCPGHSQTIYDWEAYALYRTLRDKYGAGNEKIKADMRKKFLEVICADMKDTYFFVGNMHYRPNNFIVLGAFWPPRIP